MVNFSKNVIYKIQHKENPDLVYIGSTSNYETRMSQHRQSVENLNSPDYNSRKAKLMRENGGFKAFTHSIIKKYPCKNITEVHIEEQRIMNEHLNLLNRNKAYLTPDQRIDYAAKQCKAWRERHSHTLCICGGSYNIQNKARHLNQSKKHINYMNSLLLDTNNDEHTLESDISSDSDSDSEYNIHIVLT
jgi:hypothetical protein